MIRTGCNCGKSALFYSHHACDRERINAFKKGLRETRKRIKELRKRAVELVELPFAEQQRRETEADKKDKKRDGEDLFTLILTH